LLFPAGITPNELALGENVELFSNFLGRAQLREKNQHFADPMETLARTALAIRPLRLLIQDAARRRHMQRVISAVEGYEAMNEKLRFPRHGGKEAVASPLAISAAMSADGDYWGSMLAETTDPSIEPPRYYTRDYHAYDEGNLCWAAAFEAEGAALSAALIARPDAGSNAVHKLHGQMLGLLAEYLGEQPDPSVILDLGCGIGESTIALQNAFPSSKVTGIDLSPYFLAIARHNQTLTVDQTAHSVRRNQPEFVHAAIEKLEFVKSRSVQLVSLVGVSHELPAEVLSEVNSINRSTVGAINRC
jgi:hypothetical protein